MIKLFFLAIVIGLYGCATTGPIHCITKCGLRYAGYLPGEAEGSTKLDYSIPNGWTCDALQAIEDKTILVFQQDVNDINLKEPNLCQRLNGYTVFNKNAIDWYSEPHKMQIFGQTVCWKGQIIAGNPGVPSESSLYHEFAHVGQKCAMGGKIDEGADAYHFNWVSSGIYKALDRLWNEP